MKQMRKLSKSKLIMRNFQPHLGLSRRAVSTRPKALGRGENPRKLCLLARKSLPLGNVYTPPRLDSPARSFGEGPGVGLKSLTAAKFTLFYFCYILLFLLCLPALAQPPAPDTAAARIMQDGLVSGRLDATQPRAVFYVDGLRGELIHFALTVTDGDLDPVLSIFDELGRLALHRDDSAAGWGSSQDLVIEKTGRYYVVVGRFGYALGSTAGAYELRMTRKGVLSERGSALRYGDSVIGKISDVNPEVYYTFQAEQGDILSIAMARASGALDPFLQVVDGDRFVIAENDDEGLDTRNARLDGLIIERSGTYIIVATRYDDSAGSFVLSIEEAENSGTGSTRLAPLPIAFGETKTARLDHQQYERFYTFAAEMGDIISVSQARASGDLDSYVKLSDSDFNLLVEDDDSAGNQDARIADFRIPATGAYHIIATRFEGEAGKTLGEYQLRLDITDKPFADVPPGTVNLNYGTSVSGKISADNEADLYAFYGRQGDVISIAMTRVDGNLDAYLELLDGAQAVLQSDDDGGNSQNALINNYALPATGAYYIRARRFFGSRGDDNTAGAYVLVLSKRGG